VDRQAGLALIPDTDLIESICEENNQDPAHMVGKHADVRTSELQTQRQTFCRALSRLVLAAQRKPQSKILDAAFLCLVSLCLCVLTIHRQSHS
jgi:hypothetical protein